MLFNPKWHQPPEWEKHLDAILRELDATLISLDSTLSQIPSLVERLNRLLGEARSKK